MKKLIQPFQRFFQLEASSGIVLMVFTILALAWANSPWHESYFHFFHIPVEFKFGDFVLAHSLLHWINDGLMTIFFFLVGLEIKRELAIGELSTPQKASLPIAAAIGGMVVPALIFASLNYDGPAASGWGIPMATDIAFAVGVLALLGPKVPFPLKIFLLALAIVDDLGAVMVIAFFYTESISGPALAIGAVLIGLITLMNRAGIRAIFPYVIVGTFVWLAFLKSGIHATIAGVILGLLTPHTKVETEDEPPLDHIMHNLHPWVSFFIMPVFAFGNAGVRLEGVNLSSIVASPLSMGIILGLLIGKPLGIWGFSWLAVKTKIATVPAGVNKPMLLGAGFLGGIGFTMALFISGLAIKTPELETYSKTGILVASLISGFVGYSLLRVLLNRKATA